MVSYAGWPWRIRTTAFRRRILHYIDGTHFLLAALRALAPECRFYFAGSSEMFGLAEEAPQNEGTRFHPRSSYGISKVAGFHLKRNYREAPTRRFPMPAWITFAM